MVYEIADFRVRAGDEQAFENAMTLALTSLTAHAVGMKSYRFFRCQETPQRFLLQVEWGKVEDHMVTWRQSRARDEWRSLVSRFYDGTPHMEHFTEVITG